MPRADGNFRVGKSLSWAMTVALASMNGSAYAVLAEARLQSGVGQGLRAVIPTTGVNVEDMEARCFRVFRPASSDGIAFPNDLRLDFEEVGTSKRMVARTRGAVQEPIIRFGIEWLCGPAVRREYTIFLDPVPMVEPTPLGANTPIVATPLSSASIPTSVSSPRVAFPPEASDARPTRPSRPRAAHSTLGLDAPTRRAREARARLAIRGGADGIARDLDLTVLAAPRLRLSSALTLGGTTAALTNEVDRAVLLSKRDRLVATPVESDLRPQLEVDLMIAKKRIAELQARLAAADPTGTKSAGAAVGVGAPPVDAPAMGSPSTPTSPAPTTRPAVVGPATTSPVTPTAAPAASVAAPKPVVTRESTTGSGSFVNWVVRWMWLPAVLGAAALAGTFFWLRRKQKQEAQERAYAAAAAAIGLSPDLELPQKGGGFVDTHMNALNSLVKSPSTKTRTPDSSEGDSIRTVKRKADDAHAKSTGTPMGMTTIKGHGAGPMDLSAELFQPNFDTAQLGVSMVSAVTEEASVYVELGRIEEAIAVLKDHIELERAYSRATPAPWLMLLELYYRSDNRPEFDSLRSDFMKNFNGRIPEWGAFDDINAEKSLAEHEHIVERLQRYWATPKCHQYIQKLLYDHRDNSRVGFSLTAYRELVMLDAVHSSAFPPIEQVGVEMPIED